MNTKRRLSASVDAELLDAAEAAVARGSAGRVCAWVIYALRLKSVHDRRLLALEDLIAAHEAEHGEITEDDMRQAAAAPLRVP